MNIVEEKVWFLSSSTTIYSACKKGFRVATSDHVVTVLADNKLSGYYIQPETSMVCVGYSSMGDFESFVFLEPPERGSTYDEDAVVPQQSSTTALQREGSTSFAEDTSATMSSIGSGPSERPFHSRRRSSDLSVITTETSPPASSDFIAVEDDLEENTLLGRTRIILRHSLDGTQYSKNTEFRLLCPRVCEVGGVVGILTGSPDNNKLHWFPLSKENGQELDHVELHLGDWKFDSPVLAIEYLAQHDGYFVALSCQDGTIRFIQFDSMFLATKSTTLVVDGPILCMDLLRTITGEFRLCFGSLCGYAAEMYWDSQRNLIRGPFMIAEGFLNPRLNIEDSVVCVCSTEKYVFLGTQGGRLMVCRREQNDKYRTLSELQLPYTVNAIMEMKDSQIVVATRRALHLFSLKDPLSSCDLLDFRRNITRLRQDLSVVDGSLKDTQSSQEEIKTDQEAV